MKKLITLILILLTITVNAKDCKIGYYIVLETGKKKCEIIKTESIKVVDDILNNQFDNINTYINLANILNYSRYFQISDETTYIYVEVKRITKNGKYRRIKNRHT